MIGVTVLFILFVATYWQPSIPEVKQDPLPDELPALVAPLNGEYQAEIKILLADFETSANAESAYATLLDVRVPVGFKDFHFDLAVALSEFRLGEKANGQVKLDFLKKENTWLNQ